MTDDIFDGAWVPTWNEKPPTPTTYDFISNPLRKLTDNQMYGFCMSGIPNVEDYMKSKPSLGIALDGDVAAGDQDVAAANTLNTEADEAFAAIAFTNDNAFFDEDVTVEAPLTNTTTQADDAVAAVSSTDDSSDNDDLAASSASTDYRVLPSPYSPNFDDHKPGSVDTPATSITTQAVASSSRVEINGDEPRFGNAVATNNPTQAFAVASHITGNDEPLAEAAATANTPITPNPEATTRHVSAPVDHHAFNPVLADVLASMSTPSNDLFGTDEELFPAMDSFEQFTSTHNSPASNVAAAPHAELPTQAFIDLTADTPANGYFPATAFSPPMPAQQSYIVSPEPAPANQKPIWEMSQHEINSWLASAGVPAAPTTTPAPATVVPGLESPHYAATELPSAPYTSPMPRKRKASTSLPAQQPKKARTQQRMPASPRQPANGSPSNYSWLTTPAAPTSLTAPPAAPASRPAFGVDPRSDPTPLLAFTAAGAAPGSLPQATTRISDAHWEKMYDSAVLNEGKVRVKGGSGWARLLVTGQERVVGGVRRGLVAVVGEW